MAVADAVGVGEEEVGEAVLELAERGEEWGEGGGRRGGEEEGKIMGGERQGGPLDPDTHIVHLRVSAGEAAR